MLCWNKLYFDEVYDAVVVAPTLGVARGLAAHVERGLVDRALDGMASSARVLGALAVAGARRAAVSTAR